MRREQSNNAVRGRNGRVKTMGLWVPTAGGNMGNEATLAAAIENLRRIEPRVDLRGISWDPVDTSERHGIRSYSIGRYSAKASAAGAGAGAGNGGRRLKARLEGYPRARRAARWALGPLLELSFLLGSARVLRGMDLLVFAGMGPLTDIWGGARNFPYRIFAWTYLARMCRTKVAFASIGAGPIETFWGRKLLGSAVGRAVYRSFRDEGSRRLMEDVGATGASRVFPDMVFSLTLPGTAVELAQTTSRDVAITGLPYRKPGWWYDPDTAAYERYLNSVAAFASGLMGDGYNVRMVGTQARMDPVFIRDLAARVGTTGGAGRLIVEPSENFEQVIRQLALARVVVTARFHGVVFACLLGKPVLGIAYHRKVRDLMEGMGQGEFCIDIEEADRELMRKKFKRLDQGREGVSARIKGTVRCYREQLDRQYRHLLEL